MEKWNTTFIFVFRFPTILKNGIQSSFSVFRFFYDFGKRNSNFHFRFPFFYDFGKRNSNSISVFRFFSTLENGIPISTSVFRILFSYDIGKRNSNFHFCISFFYSIKFSFSFSYRTGKRKSNFRFSFFKNESPNGSETDVHPEIINEQKKKKTITTNYDTTALGLSLRFQVAG